jgi:Tol biopolymer transport system component
VRRALPAILLAVLAGCDTDSTVNNDDVLLAVTVRASLGAARVQGDGYARSASLSADGRFVAFTSNSRTLHPDDTDATADVLVKDQFSGVIVLVSRADGADGPKGNGPSGAPRISGDGRCVAFESLATNLHADDVDPPTAPLWDIYVRDLVAHTTTLVSRRTGAGAEKGDADARDPFISRDGRRIGFTTEARLDPDDALASSFLDGYVRDLDADTTTLVTRAAGPAGAKIDNDGILLGLSADGTRALFITAALNVHPDYTDGSGRQIYVRDTVTFQTILASRAPGPGGEPADPFGAWDAALSADGLHVAFLSLASNLQPGTFESAFRLYLRDLQADTLIVIGYSDGPDSELSIAGAGSGMSLSADGRFVAFGTSTNQPESAGKNAGEVIEEIIDIYVRDTVLGVTQRLSIRTFGTPADSDSYFPSISEDARYVAFESDATNLADDDSNGELDIFIRGPLR